jgi:hypothetical protein
LIAMRKLGWVLAFLIGWVAMPARAAGAPAEPVRTRIGAFITSISDIQETQRRFEIAFWVWLLDADVQNETNPAATLEIMNAASFSREHMVMTPVEGRRWSQVKFRATVRNNLDFTSFPFDRHTLVVHLEDAERDTRTLELVVDTPPNGRAPIVLSSELDPPDWQIGEVSLTVAPHTEPTSYGDPTQTVDSEFSRATIHVEIARKHSFRILLTLLLGTFMGTLVAFFAVLLPIQLAPPRYTLISGALFVCIANRLLVDSRLPAGSSLGLLDQLQLTAILGLILLAGASLYLTNVAEKRIPIARATVLSTRMGIGWLSGIVLIQALLVLVHS